MEDGENVIVRMRRCDRILLRLLLLLIGFPAAAQFDTIRLNGVDLKLGMPKSQVFERLLKTSHVFPGVEQYGEWCVVSNEEYKKESRKCFDSLYFSGGDKLVAIDHYLEGSSLDRGAAAVVTRLWTILAEAQAKGLSVTLSARPEPLDDPISSRRVRRISFFVGQKQFDLSVTQFVGSAGSSVDFSESMGKDW